MALERTGNGYLVDPSIWSEEVMHCNKKVEIFMTSRAV
jgi:hypothetical protein